MFFRATVSCWSGEKTNLSCFLNYPTPWIPAFAGMTNWLKKMNSGLNCPRVGIDLGGTKIEIIALAPDGEELCRQRVPTPQGNYAATLDAMVQLVDRVDRQVGRAEAIGVGMPGALSVKTGRIKNANSTCLIDKPLREDLERRIERRVALANDANCFALSEATDGAGAGHAVVFGVIIGTGTGAGVVVNGKILTGPNAIAGEWGHNPLPWPNASEVPGPECYCGKAGCIETWLSGPGMQRDHLAVGGTQLTAEQIVAQAQMDTACHATLERYYDRLARGLASVINILDPDVIVLGGGMGNIAALYEEIPRRWDGYVFSDQVDTLLVPPRFGDSSGVRGAAWLNF